MNKLRIKTMEYIHYTCTGNEKYGSGNNSETAIISEKDLKKRGCDVEKMDLLSRIIACERLLAVNNPQRK